jgi:hypothetical protein
MARGLPQPVSMAVWVAEVLATATLVRPAVAPVREQPSRSVHKRVPAGSMQIRVVRTDVTTVIATVVSREHGYVRAIRRRFVHKTPQDTCMWIRTVPTDVTAVIVTVVHRMQSVVTTVMGRRVRPQVPATSGMPEPSVPTDVTVQVFVTNVSREPVNVRAWPPKFVHKQQRDTSGRVATVPTDVTMVTAMRVRQEADVVVVQAT